MEEETTKQAVRIPSSDKVQRLFRADESLLSRLAGRTTSTPRSSRVPCEINSIHTLELVITTHDFRRAMDNAHESTTCDPLKLSSPAIS